MNSLTMKYFIKENRRLEDERIRKLQDDEGMFKCLNFYVEIQDLLYEDVFVFIEQFGFLMII